MKKELLYIVHDQNGWTFASEWRNITEVCIAENLIS